MKEQILKPGKKFSLRVRLKYSKIRGEEQIVLKKRQYEVILLSYVLIMASISNYIEHQPVWRLFQIVLFVLYLVAFKPFNGRLVSNSRVPLYLLLWSILFMGSIIVSKGTTYLLNNTVKIFAPVISCLIISLVAYNDRESFIAFLVSIFWIINIWWVVNIIVLIIQISGTPLFIKSTWLANNHVYADLCCGLFGYNRTHELCFFSCFVTIYNLSMSKQIFNSKRFILVVFIIISLLLSGYISVLNDNIALFLFLPTFALTYIYTNDILEKKKISQRIKRIVGITIALVVVIFIISRIPAIMEVFNDVVYHRIERVLFIRNTINDVSGSNERLAQVVYSLSLGGSWLFGAGVGSDTINEHFTNGFLHFGINSASSYIWLLGFWFFIIELILIDHCILLCMPYMSRVKRRRIEVWCLVILVIINIYSNTLLSQASIVWIVLSFASMKIDWKLARRRGHGKKKPFLN